MENNPIRVPSSNQFIRLPKDETSGALLTLDNSIHQLLEGKAFHLSDANVVGNTNSRTLLLTTPNTSTRIHLGVKIATNVLVQYFIYENPTVSNVGTDMTSYNKDRHSAVAATLDVNHTPTVSSVGTVLTNGYLVSNNVNSERIEDRLWVLKQNEEYLVRVTNNSGGNAYITILLDWYEV
jgi:hypothetical protein